MSPEAMQLRAALGSIALCAELLKEHDDLLARYECEASLTDSLMPILNPTLWMNSERRKVDDTLRPLITATRAWLAEVDKAQGLVIGMRLDAVEAAAELGMQPGPISADAIHEMHRRLSVVRHPDKPTGSHEQMAELNAARDAALKEIGK